MEYEIHITVEARDKIQFIEDCKFIGAKAIVIEAAGEEQMMTSSKHVDNSYKARLHNMTYNLKCMGYKISREKIEIKPNYSEWHKNHKYYESHLRLKLAKSFDLGILQKIVPKSFHLSKNLFKTDDLYNYQMITYRDENTDYDSFIDTIGYMKELLNKNNIECDKIEIEECIHDTNILIDKKWMA